MSAAGHSTSFLRESSDRVRPKRDGRFRILEVTKLSWFFERSRQKSTRVELPGAVGNILLPSSYYVELESDDTLLAFPKNQQEVSLRFTSLSFTTNDQNENAALRHVEQSAKEKGYELQVMADKSVASYDEESNENGVPLTIKYWLIGQKNTLVILSATIARESMNSKHVKRVLDSVPDILESVSIRKTLRSITGKDGTTVEATVETVDPIPQEIRGFAANENSWLHDSLAEAKRLSFRYGSGADLGPAQLDEVFSAWMSSDEDRKDDAALVANALGAAFGNYFVRNHGFNWCVITDEYGIEVAIRHVVGDTTAYPRASVQKRIDAGQPKFFEGVSATVIDQLRRAGATIK